ncbi:MAG: c-type cytochrome [Deltaproteobacteria bacterium]|nr:c-type cytochrome [Deltaproteobacteria bacterium]
MIRVLRSSVGLFALGLTLGVVWATAAMAMEPLPATPPVPKDNPQTKEKVNLGRQLFFDPRLSVTQTVSCNSCHNVMASGTDNRPTSFGVFGKKGGRSAPNVWNAAFLSVQFWDGRAASLEDQAKGPILNPVEMGMPNEAAVVALIDGIPGYREQFQRVFGGKNPVTYDNIAKAIAAYERTLVTPNSPFDQYKKGKKNAMSAQAIRGMKAVEELGCTTCHSGPNFAGPAMKTGEGFYQAFPMFPGSEYEKKYHLTDDKGRYEVTKNKNDMNHWRVPTWRNVALTAPYFHNGSVATLEEAVRVMGKTQLDKNLDDKTVADIVAFLNSLTGQFPAQTMPVLPPTPNTTTLPEAGR